MRLPPLAVAGTLLFCTSSTAAAEPPLAPLAKPAPPPPGGYTPRMRYERHSPALLGGGITLVVLGAISLAGAATFVAKDLSTPSEDQGILSIVAGLPLLLHGIGCIAGGIPMIVVGNRTIPTGYASPSLSPGRVTTLRWTF